MVRTLMRGCLRNMDNIIHSIIDLDIDSRLMVMKIVSQGAIAEELIDEGEEETLVRMWLTELNILDNIRESIEAQELLSEDQKDYIWSIVLEGV